MWNIRYQGICEKILLAWLFAMANAPGFAATNPSAVDAKHLSRIDLRDGWKLQVSSQVGQDGSIVSTTRYMPKGWYNTTIPSTVLKALTKNGVYPDMRIGLNSFKILDSSDEFNKRHGLSKYSHLPDKQNPWRLPWWYRTEFSLPELPQDSHVWLHFDAINYRAEVWMNGKQVADCNHMVGMFRRFTFDITAGAVVGENVLAVKTYPVDHPGDPDTQLEVFGRPRMYFKEIMRDVTEIMTVGYDCMPTVPDRNMGIWQQVYIDFTGPVDIRHPFVITDLPLPNTDKVTLRISTELVNDTGSLQRGILRGTILETGLEFEKRLELAPGETKEVFFERYPVMEQPRLWWPVNYGPQNLYQLDLDFRIEGRLSDRESVTFGVREISKELYKLDDAHGMRLHINGKKIFCRGGYIQPEVLFDWDQQRMETEVKYFTSANLNLVYFEDIPNPPQGFLEACDKYGLLFGNCYYSCYWLRPGTNYPDDLELLEQCTIDITKRYRNHPSLWLYMAMNEEDTREVVCEMWRKHIIALDGTRLWIPSAYFPDGRKHVPEWFKQDLPTGMTDIGATYTWKEPQAYYDFVRNDRRWMFMMESGSASLPPIESLARFIPDLGQDGNQEVYPLDSVWAHHGANSYYRDYDQAIRRIYGQPESVADYCMKGHLITADQHRAMFEAVNHRMWDITSGFTQWKINACWPSVQWQIFDWYLKPMVSYYYIKRACEPLHVQLNLPDNTVAIINNRLTPQEQLRVRAQVYDFNMRCLWQKQVQTDIQANTYKDLFSIPDLQQRSDLCFVDLTVQDIAGNTISDNFYWLARDRLEQLGDLAKLALVNLSVSHEVESHGSEKIIKVNLHNPTDKLTFFVHVAVTEGRDGEEILPVFWNDNYCSLMPGTSRELVARIPSEKVKQSLPIVEFGGWNVRSGFECNNIRLPTGAIELSKPFEITADISDTFIDGSPVEVYVDNTVVQTRRVWARKDSQKVSFTLQLESPGTHLIRIGEKEVKISMN